MYCGRCCVTEPRLSPVLRLDIFIEILLGTSVKIALAAAHFHSVGVARQGPWSTWVNKGVRRGRPRPSKRPQNRQ